MAMVGCLPFKVVNWCIDWTPPLLSKAISDVSKEVPLLKFHELYMYLNLKFKGLSKGIQFDYTNHDLPQPINTHH
jgi:hypothetical protein